jgi:SAM-dependent methyltransferase
VLRVRQGSRDERRRVGHLDHPRRSRVHAEEHGAGEPYGPQDVRQHVDWRRPPGAGLGSIRGGRSSRRRRRAGRSSKRSGPRVMVRHHAAILHSVPTRSATENPMSTTSEAFRLSAAAEMYEAIFVPALFAEWAPLLVEFAGVTPGQAVLDVACGTGIVARTVADVQRGQGRVVGLDLNPAMLDVARRLRPDIEWRQGDAASLPFPDGSFDVALCQMAFMFFPDRRQALREMARVVTPTGTVAFAVPGGLGSQPGLRAGRPAGRASRRARGDVALEHVLRVRRARRPDAAGRIRGSPRAPHPHARRDRQVPLDRRVRHDGGRELTAPGADQ